VQGANDQSDAESRRIAIRIHRSPANGERWLLESHSDVGGYIMTKMARSWCRASVVAMMLAATALSEPAFAKAQDGRGFIPHNRLAQNVTTASTPAVAGQATATQRTAASEPLRVLPAAVWSTAALPAAVSAFERLPAWVRRQIPTPHSAVAGAGQQGDSENLNGGRS
jgi:hypothetical protein